MAWSDWAGPLLGTAAGVGTAFIPGVGPTLAPIVGQGVNASLKGIDTATKKAPYGSMNAAQAVQGPNGLTQLSKFTGGPQQQLHDETIKQALALLQGGKSQTFQPIANEARANFASQTVPSLAERFGGKGNERGSSALTGQIAGAGSGLERALAALQAQYGQKELGTLLKTGLQPSFNNVNFEGSGAYSDIAGDIGEWLPKLLDAFNQYRNQPSEEEAGEPGFDLNNLENNQQKYDLDSILSNLYRKQVQNQPGMPGYQYNLGGRPA
jgi:hypothetical protein